MGYLFESLNSKLKKEHYYEQEWIEAADVNTFVCHIPRPDNQGGDIYPGKDYVPIFDIKYWYKDNLVKLKLPGDERRIYIAKVQAVVRFDHLLKGSGILELYDPLPDYPIMGSPVRKVFGDNENLLNERLTEKYHKDLKTGKNLDVWLDPEEKGQWMASRGG